MKINIILVSCNNYSGSANYNIFVERRKEQLLHENSSWKDNTDVKFIHFNINTGEVKINRIENGSRSWFTSNTSFERINDRNHYQGTAFKQQNTSVISITDVYDYIERLGRTEPESVQEVSFFGHSWMGGPILVNSYQRDEYKTGSKAKERDSWDKDGRLKDFNTTNMSSSYWRNLRKAFKTDGYFWLWGCLFSRMHYVVLNKLVHSRSYRNTPISQHTDNDIIEFSFSRSFANKYYDKSNFFPNNTSTTRFSKTILDVKKFLEKGMLASYPGKVAGDLGIDCYSALIGTYSIYESGGQNSYPLMKIADGGRGHGADFSKHIQFFKTYMNMETDPEDKGYGKYKANIILAWWKRYILQ